jgi:hypothetical protein
MTVHNKAGGTSFLWNTWNSMWRTPRKSPSVASHDPPTIDPSASEHSSDLFTPTHSSSGFWLGDKKYHPNHADASKLSEQRKELNVGDLADSMQGSLNLGTPSQSRRASNASNFLTLSALLKGPQQHRSAVASRATSRHHSRTTSVIPESAENSEYSDHEGSPITGRSRKPSNASENQGLLHPNFKRRRGNSSASKASKASSSWLQIKRPRQDSNASNQTPES